MNYYEDILLRLRSKPRLGATEFNETAEGFSDPEYIKALNAMLEAFGATVLDVGGNIKTITNTMDNLKDGSIDLSMGIGKVIRVQEKWDEGIESLVKNITWLEERNKEINKTFGVSSEKAEEYAQKLRAMAEAGKFSDDTLSDFNKSLNDMTGGMLMSKHLDTARANLYAFQATAVKGIGVTEEAAIGFETYARMVGTSGDVATVALSDMAKAIADKTGIDQLSIQRDIMQEIGSLSSDVRMNYSKMPGNLEVAVLKAKALGFTMDQLDKTGESLMNIEQSVGNELEYQLLSGRRLTTESGKSFTNEYRKAKLMGDATKQAELMGDILAKEGKTLKGNYLARQKFAETMGMSADELSKALEKQTIAQELGATQLMKLSGKELTSEIDKLRKAYKAEGQTGADKLTALNKFLEANDTRTTHEKVMEDNTISMAKSINAMATGYTNLVKDVKAIVPNAIKKSYDDAKTGLATTSTAKNMGKVYKTGEVYKVTKDAQDNIRKGLTGTVVGGTAEKVYKKLDKTAGGKVSMESGTGRTKKTDTVIYPDGAAPVVLDKKDTVYAMRPGDRFDKQLNKSHRDAFAAGERVTQQSFAGNQISRSSKPADNSMSMIAAALQRIGNNTTSTPALDVNALASAIATAMQSVKIEAKIRTDDMYSSNRMNNRKNII